VRRIYIEIPEPAFREAARRALDKRRGVREQVGYDLERLYRPDAIELREPDQQPAEAPR
jgi:hypothetical protein